MEKDLLAILIASVAALCGLIVVMIKNGFNKIWAEIEKLRKVRHDNLDHLTQMDAKLTIIEFTLTDLKKDMVSKYNRMKEIIKNSRSWKVDGE